MNRAAESRGGIIRQHSSSPRINDRSRSLDALSNTLGSLKRITPILQMRSALAFMVDIRAYTISAHAICISDDGTTRICRHSAASSTDEG